MGSEAPLVAHARGESLVFEHLLEGVERLHPRPQSGVEGVESQRHDHELLHVERIVGVGPAVDDVHHRGGEEAGGGPAEVAVERQPAVLGGGMGHRHRDTEDRVGAELFLGGRAVELEHEFVARGLVESVTALEFLGDPRIHILDGGHHALAQVNALVAIPLLPGLVGAGARAGGHRRPAKCPVGERHVDLERGIAAAVEDLAGVDVDDRGHGTSGSGKRNA